MKIIDLKTSKENVIVNNKTIEIDITTVELLKTTINSPVQGGYSVSEMMTRIKLLDKVQEVEKSIKDGNIPTTIAFEDSEFTHLGKLVKDSKWVILSKFIVDFTQSFDKKN